MQLNYHNVTRLGLITAWAMFSLLSILPAKAFEYPTGVWSALPHGALHPSGGPEDATAGDGVGAPFIWDQLATSTAVTSPTATVVSPTPANTALPPTQPTNTVSATRPTGTEVPTAMPGREATPIITAQPASATASLTAASTDVPTLTPTSEQVRPEASSPALTGEPMTVTAPPVPVTESLIPTQEVATATAIVESRMKDPTTYTAQVAASSGSLLDRLTRNKPGVWGNKAFYVGLGVVYLVLLALFLRLVFRLGRQSD